jgi:hypothetical protein
VNTPQNLSTSVSLHNLLSFYHAFSTRQGSTNINTPSAHGKDQRILTCLLHAARINEYFPSTNTHHSSTWIAQMLFAYTTVNVLLIGARSVREKNNSPAMNSESSHTRYHLNRFTCNTFSTYLGSDTIVGQRK